MFSVFLENQHVKAQAGWFAKERAQRVDLWISVYADIKSSNPRDELSHTLDYSDLVGIVITESARERKLLETLATDIIEAIHSDYHAILRSVEVVIRKKKVQVTGFEADAVGIRCKKTFE